MNSEGADPASVHESHVLAAVLDSLTFGVVVCNVKGELTLFNREAERILGLGIVDLSPDQWSAAYGCYLPDRVTPYPSEDLPLARAIRGEEVLHELIFLRHPKQPEGVWIDVSGRPVTDGAGTPRGGVAVIADVTELQNLLRGSTAPARAANSGERFIHFRRIYAQLVRAVEQTGDGVIITDREGVIEYVNPAFEETTGYSATEALGLTPRLLKSGKHDPQFYQDLWRRLLAGRPFRGTIVNRKKSGELYWAEQTISPIKDERQQITHFVSVLKDITALKAKQEQEFALEVAREVQQRFYSTTATLPGFDIAGAAFPADQTGGDYFDLLSQPDGSLYIIIADVTGHGLGSALLMAETRACLRSYATVAPDITALLKSVNSTLTPDLGGSQFVTLFLGRLDAQKHTLEYVSAGHEPCFLLRHSGEPLVMESTAPPLGLFASREFGPVRTLQLQQDDTIVLLTDGVSETYSTAGAQFGAGRALEYLRAHPAAGAAELLKGIYDSARAFADGEPQRDDFTLVICKVE